MGGIEREIIWSEKVRPSSPTPRHLKTYMLSMLDQLTPSTLVPVTLYFPSNAAGVSDFFISHTAETLKRSLSLILSRFYPLAGRVSGDGHSIDCNDEGVPFAVARFRGCNLSDHVLKNQDPSSLRRLLPGEFDSLGADYSGGPDSSVAMIQTNFFDCGGVAVAVAAVFWHRAVDAGAIFTFIRSWAAAARGSTTEAACPNFISQSLFSHKEELQKKQSLDLSAFLVTGNPVLRRYVFDAAAVAKLMAECGGTRVEAVSALIWKCFMAASLANNISSSVLNTVVNLRRRAQPPFPPECFGNWTGVAAAASSNESTGADLGKLARRIRDSIRKVDGDFVERLRGDGGASGLHENMRRTWSDVPVGGGAADNLIISSWCGFGFYSIDFGWGKPVWLTGTFESNAPFINLVWLIEGRNGDGVEAWVTLDHKYMSIFEQLNEELMDLVQEDQHQK